jgi:hypothetical protein
VYLFVDDSRNSYGLAFLIQRSFTDFPIGAQGDGVSSRTQTLSVTFRGVRQHESAVIAEGRCLATGIVLCLLEGFCIRRVEVIGINL